MRRWFVYFWGCRLPNGFTGTIFRTREYGEGACFLFVGLGVLNGFTGTIFRTRECEESTCFSFWACVVPSGFMGTIFRTREYVEMLGSLGEGCGVEKIVGTNKAYPLFIKVYCLVTV